MQYPAFEGKRRVMLDNVGMIDDMIRLKCAEEPGQILLWLLGKRIEGVKEESMVCFWLTAGAHITGMYREITKARYGIG